MVIQPDLTSAAVSPGSVALRSIPYPYRAMLAICSDLDETPDRHVYYEIMRFLNTTETTTMGPGVGLEVGNSIYFDMPPHQFAYWNTDDAGREMVGSLIRSGHIDCLHSYGDLVTRRAQAAGALEELDRRDCRLKVWVDHAVASSNFGSDIMKGRGDLPGSEVYHADLTCDYGVEYVWRGRVTSVIGQDVERSVGGIVNTRHLVRSAKTAAKEMIKGVLARSGSTKYAMHGSNKTLRKGYLRNGRGVYEFMRANPYWGGVQHGATAHGLADVLTADFLSRLVARNGVCVLYTHLGKVKVVTEPLDSRTRGALRRLARFYRKGQILVTTTRRVLDFRRATEEVDITAHQDERGLRVDVRTDAGADGTKRLPLSSLVGLTIYVAEPDKTRVMIDGREVEGVHRNAPDHTGCGSVSLPWARLEFPVP